MITEKQLKALRHIILRSDVPDLAKKILFFLIDRSDRLSKEVSITLTESELGYNRKEITNVAYKVGSLSSSEVGLCLHPIFVFANLDWSFYVRYGSRNPDGTLDSSGKFLSFEGLVSSTEETPEEILPVRYTFWLSQSVDSETAESIEVTEEELANVELVSDFDPKLTSS